MKVNIRGNVFEGTPEEIREYVSNDQIYLGECVKRYHKCPYCGSPLGEWDHCADRAEGIRKQMAQCTNRQCKAKWGYNETMIPKNWR